MTELRDLWYNTRIVRLYNRKNTVLRRLIDTMGGTKMSEIKLKENESLDNALRRFKRQCAKNGVLTELRKREHYEKPSVKRKKKSEAARKRKYR
mgnify:CR=1 FL=1